MADKVPAWISAYITHCYPLLGLIGWEISTQLADHVECGDAETMGQANTSFRYLRATLTLHRAIQPDEVGYTLVTHELLHIACGHQSQAVCRMKDLLPKRQRSHAASLWADGNEQTIETLARALTPLLRAGLPAEDAPQ